MLTLCIRIEVASGGFIKRHPDGSIDFFSPFPSPFAYGSVVGTLAADGDPEDALVVGEAPGVGTDVEYPVWGCVHFVDAGLEDNKWVMGPRAPTAADWRKIAYFFRVYAVAKRLRYRWRCTPGETHFERIERFGRTFG